MKRFALRRTPLRFRWLVAGLAETEASARLMARRHASSPLSAFLFARTPALVRLEARNIIALKEAAPGDFNDGQFILTDQMVDCLTADAAKLSRLET